jgi:hypothetical protein
MLMSLGLLVIGSLSDIAPSAAASSFEEDLLQDDLPSNSRFVNRNPRTNNKRFPPTQSSETETSHSEKIRILSRRPFDLYQDYMTELEESKVRSEALRQVGRSLLWRMMSDLNLLCSLSPLFIVGAAINIRILLYGGYDWQATRSAIESETNRLRQRLRKLSQLISSGNAPPPELRRTNVELFNSIHIGIPDEDDFPDDEQLLAAIESELADLDSETASHTTFQANMPLRSNNGVARAGQAGKKKLRRSRRPQMEFSLLDMAFRYTEEEPGGDVAGSLKLTMERAEIIDHIKTSTWKTFMTEMKKNGTILFGETGAKMLRVLVEWVNPGLEQASEARVHVRGRS